ncbi:sulfatase [Polaribacter sp. Z022]|uniref:sulfatase family protein n=1 Tax=Polaribacter sp. Z022 TaxID=2927125 RepID=UPI0020214702|nr:sulfatase [Polaribacter sp. Z022]MCL7754599.1 sulfatase [Polaribacter sp. Z022]
MKTTNLFQKVLFLFIILCFLSFIKINKHSNEKNSKPILKEKVKPKPNLIIIQTDEHNFRTLSAYQKLLSKDQALVWGENAKIETPFIDSLAEEGAIYTSYYSTSPVCTPSRASFVSGLYPYATGADKNDNPLKDNIVTFAEILRRDGYATSYVGKWHLEGRSKKELANDKKSKICFIPERKFGFTDNRFMINNGHSPYIKELKDGRLKFVNGKKSRELDKNGKSKDGLQYLTDFLTDKSLEILERDKNEPFCLMLSIPDPHTPNVSREPYTSMYKNMKFEIPETMRVITDIERPKSGSPKNKNEAKEFNQTYLRNYFGMVKSIDDSVGRILKFLKDNNLEKNTIVVFTSDHGDMLFEHKRRNKSVPYESSSRIPFLIKYPKKIKAGKVIHKAYTTADFAPTILSLMDAKPIPNTHGIDDSKVLQNNQKEVFSERITYTRNTSTWVTAVSDNYKLILSKKEKPWLFDLKKDPNELYNVYNKKGYKDISSKMLQELKKQMTVYKDPHFKGKQAFNY